MQIQCKQKPSKESKKRADRNEERIRNDDRRYRESIERARVDELAREIARQIIYNDKDYYR